MIEEQGGEENGEQTGAEPGKDGNARDKDEAERQRRSVQGGGADAEDDADPGEKGGRDVTTNLDQEAPMAGQAGARGDGQRVASCNGSRPGGWVRLGSGCDVRQDTRRKSAVAVR